MHVWKVLGYSLFSALPRKPESAIQLPLCHQEPQLWKHQSPHFIHAALINVAVGSHLNWGQHWKLQAIQAQTSKSEAKDRWHGMKRVRWGVMMETQSSLWYWAFQKAALATHLLFLPLLPLAIPPQPGFKLQFALKKANVVRWLFCLSALNSACHLPSTSWPCSCAR